ncbi:hypothetical protein SEPCBS57363_006511 [Sporothrix epigloea]|uniref:DUF3669 domain-containing protein n=1 Tax=Sporothrix epigloea TaxID=1892477 RepID=A0ABP0E6M4_9PEZI
MSSSRAQNAADDSARSNDSADARSVQTAFRYLTTGELDGMAATDVLRQSLTIRSVISTASTYAKRAQRSQDQSLLTEIKEIGEGLQGAIFEQLGSSQAMKKEKLGNEKLPFNLNHEYRIHAAVEAAFDRFNLLVDCQVYIPQLVHFKEKQENQPYWDNCLQQFPAGHRRPGDMITMEKILPMPKVVREAIIKEFYPVANNQPPDSTTIQKVLGLPSNKNSLIRTYFGKEDIKLSPDSFTLRNFPLCWKPMERVGLDVDTLVAEVGKAYALMHWGAGVNGDDVEFVLGSYIIPSEAGAASTPDSQHRAIGLFLLDFGQCSFIDLAEDFHVVYQVFRGAMVTGDNQNFIPNLRKTPALFAIFKNAYINAGQKILSEKHLETRFDIDEFMQLYEEYAEDFLLY